MPFLEDLIKRGGRRGGEPTRRHTADRSLTGESEDSRPGPEDLLRQGRKSGLLGGEVLAGDRRRECGNAACGFGWTMPWKSREHPIFEGRWACSGRCLGAMVRAALSRVADDGIDDDGPRQHQHRIPLGLVMLAQGWITHPQLQQALEAQRSHGSGRIGEWLVSECGMKPERIARGLSVQWNCPVLSTESFWPEAMALALPRLLLEEYGAVPLRLAGRQTLYVGFKDGLDASASFAIEQMTGLKTESGLLPETEFGRARKILLGCAFPEQSQATVSDRDGLAHAIVETVEHEQPEASRLVRLHRYYWLRIWAKGQNDRAAGDMPANVAGVRDYLFTIGSRVTHSIPSERSHQPAAVPQRFDVFEKPSEAEAEAETILNEPEAATAEKTKTAAGGSVEDRATIVVRAPGPAVVVVEAAVEAPVLEAAVVEAAAVDVAIEAATVNYPILESPGVEAGFATAPAVTEVEEVLIAAATPVRHFLARQESWFADGENAEEPAVHGQIVRPDELDNLQRFMRRSFETDSEPIDGEYLLELTSVESSVLVSADRATGWSRLGQLLRPRSSYPVRELDSVSGRDRAV